MRGLAGCLAGIVVAGILAGCAEETIQRPPARPLPEPASRVGGVRPAAPPVPAPPVKREPPKESASPWLFVSPQLGRWAWRDDPSFVVVLNEKGQVEYGPFFRGTYRMVDKETIELTLEGTTGQFVGKRPGPILFRVEFFEGGQVMVFRQGENAVVLQRSK